MLLLTGLSASAEAQATKEQDGKEPKRPRVRVAFSKSAAKRLHQRRARKLLAIELDRIAPLDPSSAGPLDNNIIRVWIDVPTPRRALIEVRRSRRSRARRTLDITAYPSDAAARLVAIATSEMVRVQSLAKRPRETHTHGPSAGSHSQSGNLLNAFRVGSSVGTLWLPKSDPGFLMASELWLEHHSGISGISLYGRWAAAPDPLLRWYELGGGISGHVALGESPWRFHAALRGGAVSLAIPQAARIKHRTSPTFQWLGRAGGQIGVERALGRSAWLGLAVEPGATLGVLHTSDQQGVEHRIGGFTLGLKATLVAESN